VVSACLDRRYLFNRVHFGMRSVLEKAAREAARNADPSWVAWMNDNDTQARLLACTHLTNAPTPRMRWSFFSSRKRRRHHGLLNEI
jgi:hypothetical protein